MLLTCKAAFVEQVVSLRVQGGSCTWPKQQNSNCPRAHHGRWSALLIFGHATISEWDVLNVQRASVATKICRCRTLLALQTPATLLKHGLD